MAKHIDRRGQLRSVSKRLSALERKVGELTKEAPPRPEDLVAREARPGEGRGDYLKVRPGNASFEGPVADHMKRLQGRSVSDVADDRTRGARSPLEDRGRR